MSVKRKENFYALCFETGNLVNLGKHEDWFKAEKYAQSSLIEVLWLFGEDTAQQWKETLSNERANNGL